MTYLMVSRILFWTFIVLWVIALGIWVSIIERNDRHQERLAAEHRQRRRTQRFNNLQR